MLCSQMVVAVVEVKNAPLLVAQGVRFVVLYLAKRRHRPHIRGESTRKLGAAPLVQGKDYLPPNQKANSRYFRGLELSSEVMNGF